MSKDVDDKIYTSEPKCYVGEWRRIKLNWDGPQLLNCALIGVTTELETAIHNLTIDVNRSYEYDKSEYKIIKELWSDKIVDHPDDMVYIAQYAYTKDHQDYAINFEIYERDLIGGNAYEQK